MSKTYTGIVTVILPVVDVTGNDTYLSFHMSGPICRRKILRVLRRYLKTYYGTSLRKYYFQKRVIIEGDETPYKDSYYAFSAFVNRIAQEEEERRALEAEGNSNNQVEDAGGSDVPVCTMSDRLDGCTV